MAKLRVFFYLVIGLFLAGIAGAATIYGSVYDISLKRTDNARIEINTTPKQMMVDKNGTYSFNVPNGAYKISAGLMQKTTMIAATEENITISSDGSYVLDLILFPDIEEGVAASDINFDSNIIESKSGSKTLFLVLLGALLICILLVLYHVAKKRQQEAKTEEKYPDEAIEQLLKIIKENGGRTTQKDIRKQIPFSEAKISLMIAELEHKGLIEKIKKGRGNIIILKK